MLERQGFAASGRLVQLPVTGSYALCLSPPLSSQAIARPVAPFNTPVLGPIAALLTIAIAHIAGIALHVWFEKPLIGLFMRRRAGGPETITGKPGLTGEVS